MVTCNLFELRLSILNHDDPIVSYDFRTDMPPGTRVILTCQRTYLDASGSLSLWIGYNEMITLEAPIQDGCCQHHGQIDIDSSDQKAFDLFGRINSGDSPGVSTSISEEVTIVLTVGARQRLREFGRNNADLVGKMVLEDGDIRYVEISESILIPMNPAYQPSSEKTGPGR